MPLGLCGPSSGEVYSLIYDGWANYQNLANQQINDMEKVVNDLTSFLSQLPLSTINTEIESVLDKSDFGSDFAKPSEPKPDNMVYEKPQPVLSVDVKPVPGPVISDKPTFIKKAPTISVGGEPATFTEAAPDTSITLSDLDVPDVPDVAATLPSVEALRGQLRTVDIPTRQTLILPEWTETKPTDDTYIPRGNFGWAEDAYSTTAQTEIQTEITRRFNGGTGLPTEFWNAFLQRDQRQQEESALRAEEEITDLWARNGWDQPTFGETNALSRVRQGVFNQESGRRREVWLQQVKMEEDSLRFAVTQGIASETMLTGFHSAKAARALQAAQYAQDVTIRLARLQIERLNARYGAYATDAQVYRTRIEGEVAKLEERRQDLEEARVKAELNDQDIRVFLAQYEAADKLIKLYLGEIEAVKVQNERDKIRVEVLGEQVSVYAEKIRANSLLWDGWAKKIDGQVGVAQLYKSEVEAFGELMRGYGIESDAENQRVDSEVKLRTLDQTRVEADTRRYEAESRAETDRISALARKFEALVRQYEGAGRIEESRVRSEDNRTQIVMAELRAQESLKIRKSEVDIQQIVRLLDLEKESIESILNVRAQLVASLYSAFNMNAGVTGGFENASVCQTNYEG